MAFTDKTSTLNSFNKIRLKMLDDIKVFRNISALKFKPHNKRNAIMLSNSTNFLLSNCEKVLSQSVALIVSFALCFK